MPNAVVMSEWMPGMAAPFAVRVSADQPKREGDPARRHCDGSLALRLERHAPDDPRSPSRSPPSARRRRLARAGIAGSCWSTPSCSPLTSWDVARGSAGGVDPWRCASSRRMPRRLEALVERRAAREPLQHITGTAPFRHLELRGRARASSCRDRRPRSSRSSRSMRCALRRRPRRSPSISARAAARSRWRWRPKCRTRGVYAAEKSPDAFVWAKENFEPSVQPMRGSCSPISPRRSPSSTARACVVISNPPYVPDDAIPRDPEVRLFDPADGALRRPRRTGCRADAERGRSAPAAPGRRSS